MFNYLSICLATVQFRLFYNCGFLEYFLCWQSLSVVCNDAMHAFGCWQGAKFNHQTWLVFRNVGFNRGSIKIKLTKLCLNWQVEIWQRVNKTKLREDLQKLLEKGIHSLAVVFLHSYTCVFTTSTYYLYLYYFFGNVWIALFYVVLFILCCLIIKK